jgi:ABC-type glycerol-3-phosphate transport system substrate-binding protein
MKRGFSVISRILIVICLLFSFSACKDAKNTSSVSSEESSSPLGVGKDLGGRTITVAAWWDLNPTTETEAGIQDLERLKQVEKKYNCKVEYKNIPYDTIKELLTSSAVSGSEFVDVVWLKCVDAIPVLAKKGYIIPLDDYFDFKDSRWPALGLRASLYNGKHYGFTTDVQTTHGIWYNVSLFKRLSLPDPYELQEKGAWTWEKYLDIAKRATVDADNDGTPESYGLIVGYPIIDRLIYSNGGEIIKESDGKYVFNMDDPKVIEALKFTRQVYDANVIMEAKGTESQAYFAVGNIAMYGGEAFMGKEFQLNTQDELGFVFYPKGPKASGYTSVTDSTNIMTIPVSTKSAQDVAAVMNDLIIWDNIDQKVNDFFNGNLMRQEDVASAKKMLNSCQIQWVNAFSKLSDIVFKDISSSIITGELSPETAVAKNKAKGQAIIDDVMK